MYCKFKDQRYWVWSSKRASLDCMPQYKFSSHDKMMEVLKGVEWGVDGQYGNINDCEYPVCDLDEVLPVYILWEGNEIEAWYRNLDMYDCWFESDTGAVFDGAIMWKIR